jgi:hypothetical protein
MVVQGTPNALVGVRFSHRPHTLVDNINLVLIFKYMSIEGGSSEPKTKHDEIQFINDIKEVESDVARLLASGEAYEEYKFDKDNNFLSVKVFKNDGTLIFYTDNVDTSNSVLKPKMH